MKVVAVTGSRGWTDKERIRKRLLELKPDVVVQGGAKDGADKLAREICDEEGIRCETENAKWERYGRRAAGRIRNGEMLQNWQPDRVVAFWDEISTGTKDCLDKADSMGFNWEVNGPDGTWYDDTTWML